MKSESDDNCIVISPGVWDLSAIPDEIIYREAGLRANKLKTNFPPGPGKPRSNAPRCPCQKMTKRMAEIRYHKCSPPPPPPGSFF